MTQGGTGTLRWMAPELLEGKTDASKESDVYAFGMVMYEVRVHHNISIGYAIHRYKVLAGVAPFVDSPPTTVAVQVLSGRRPDRPKHASLNEVWDLAQCCWGQEPLHRPDISEVVSRLEGASIVRRSPADIAVGGGTARGSTLREWSRGFRRAPHSFFMGFRLTRSNDMCSTPPQPAPRQFRRYRKLSEPSPNSRDAEDSFHTVGSGGSETNLHSTRSGGTVRSGTFGLCGLLRIDDSRGSNCGIQPPRNRLSEKV